MSFDTPIPWYMTAYIFDDHHISEPHDARDDEERSTCMVIHVRPPNQDSTNWHTKYKATSNASEKSQQAGWVGEGQLQSLEDIFSRHILDEYLHKASYYCLEQKDANKLKLVSISYLFQ